MRRVLLALALALPAFFTRADDGYRLWLRYDAVTDAKLRSEYAAATRRIILLTPTGGNSPTLDLAKSELAEGFKGLLGAAPEIVVKKSDQVPGEISHEGFAIHGLDDAIEIFAQRDVGALYGVFTVLRQIQAQRSLLNLPNTSRPRIQRRLLNHWDNLDRSVERGYAGQSLWDWDKLPAEISPRYRDYARACASIGLNGVVPVNVNASAQFLTARYLKKIAALADVFRPYGIRRLKVNSFQGAIMPDVVTRFYLHQLPGAELKNNVLQAPCPFCTRKNDETGGQIVVFLNQESYFHGYFRCLNRCVAGGFPLHFSRLRGISLTQTPGYDPDREHFGREVDYPAKNINNELPGFTDKLTGELHESFRTGGVGQEVLAEMHIGYNGRYLVYPYILADGNCYAARCVHPERPEDFFWHGDEQFFADRFRLFNAQEIERCENGTLFLVEGEKNLLPLKQLGLPGIAVASAADLDHIEPLTLTWIRTVFLWTYHNAESEAKAKAFATRVGYKVRIIRWPENAVRNASIFQLAVEAKALFQKTVFTMITVARAFSPFPTPAGEYHTFNERLARESSDSYSNMTSGFTKLDRALGGLHGINIIGGTPKAGKSAFFIQIASEMALRKLPVLYYDFENGRQKIYLRILCRLSRLSIDQIKSNALTAEERKRLQQAKQSLQNAFHWLRVVNDRKLSPETMRRHIDFLRHETNSHYTVVVIDSLHKLPFKDIGQQRSGIDGWLRQLEAIRDEMAVSFLVISELERGQDNQFDRQPNLTSFKGSGDIGYSADNAMVLLPDWDPFDNNPPGDRTNQLWLVASREQSPGRIGTYRLDYPYWGFKEV